MGMETMSTDSFVEIYKKWILARQWAAKKELTYSQRTNLEKMDAIKKVLWNALPEARRREIVDELISQGFLPKSLTKCLEVFDRKVIGL
jgi:hypothetical protein